MSRKTKKLMWSVPLVAVFAVVGALAAFIALAPSEAQAQDAQEMLGPPLGLTATKVGQTVIELSWMAPSTSPGDVTAYRVDESSDEMVWTELVTSIENPFYDRINLMPGDTKYYRVFAIYGDKGEGEPSEVASATTDAATVPGKPTGLAVVNSTTAGTSELDMTWAAPSSDGGSPITGYMIERLKDGETTWMTVKADTGLTNDITVDCTACPYTDDGVIQATQYHYRVSAINKVGTGAASDTDDETVEASSTGPAGPTGLTAQGTNAAVTLHWLAPSDPAGDPITEYIVDQSPDGADWTTIATVKATRTYHRVGGAFRTGTTPWQYRVTGKNAGGGDGLPSATLAVGPPNPATHGPAQNLRVRSKSPLTINVSWRPASGSATDTSTTYRVDYSSDGQVWKAVPTASLPTAIDATSGRFIFDDTGLKIGERRHYRVIATTGTTLHQMTNAESATAGPLNKPDKPTALAVTNEVETVAQADKLVLSWTAPADDGDGDNTMSAITGYKIERSLNATSWTTIKADTGMADVSYTDEKLMANTQYHYRVSAINKGATGDASDSASGKTAVAVAPGIPSGLVAVARGMSRIDLYWRTPGDQPGAPVTGYMVEVSEDDGSSWRTLVANTNSRATKHSHSVTGEATRTYRVSAINSVGTSAPSDPDEAMSGMDTQPTMLGPATGVNASPGTRAGTAEVTWTPGPAATMHWIYAIRADEGEGGYTFEQASSNNSHTLTGLDSGVEYIVGISAGKGQLPGGEWSEWMLTRVTPN